MNDASGSVWCSLKSGEKNEITVSEEEIRRAVFEKAQQYPGQEKEVVEFYQKNPQAMAELRAPIFEERVVDFIVELADTKERNRSRRRIICPGCRRR